MFAWMKPQVMLFICCWYKELSQEHLGQCMPCCWYCVEDTCFFSAIPIYGSMCYKASPKDSSNEKWVNSTIIDEFQNKSIPLLRKTALLKQKYMT